MKAFGSGDTAATISRAVRRGARAPATNRHSIRRDALETIILDALRARLLRPDLVAEFAEAWQQEVNRQRAGADATRETDGELAQVERKLAGLVEAIAACAHRRCSRRSTTSNKAAPTSPNSW